MDWDGVERRKAIIVEFCKDHISMSTDIAVIKSTLIGLDKRINGALTSIEKHMTDGEKWRVAIIGLIVTFIIQVGTFLFLWGKINKQVEINTGRISSLEELHPRSEHKEL